MMRRRVDGALSHAPAATAHMGIAGIAAAAPGFEKVRRWRSSELAASVVS